MYELRLKFDISNNLKLFKFLFKSLAFLTLQLWGFILRFNGAIVSLEWKEAVWDKYVT